MSASHTSRQRPGCGALGWAFLPQNLTTLLPSTPRTLTFETERQPDFNVSVAASCFH